MFPIRVRIGLSLLLMLLICRAEALPEDKTAMIQVEADSADLNQSQHQGRYQGHVRFIQGSTHLAADSAVTLGDENNQLIKAIAKGSPRVQAHFWTTLAKDKPELHAYADEIRYDPKQHRVYLLGHARLVQGKNSFAAPEIVYDVEKQQLISKGSEQSPTLITFYPESRQP